MFAKKKTSDVFGVSNIILPDSYVDRGSLDQHIQLLLGRRTHIALRGESKCGKSWLRQKNIPSAITIQCRLKKKIIDLYVDALSQLEIKLIVDESSSSSFKASVEARGEVGAAILAKLGFKSSVSTDTNSGSRTTTPGHDINDLRYIADIIKESERRLVIEDFHYMSVEERASFAFDLKALWDYGVFVIIIGVWSQNNMLIHLNPDLSGRIEEVSIYWSDPDLDQVITKGASALELNFSGPLKKRAIGECFGNAGILQKLVLDTLDQLGIKEKQSSITEVSALDALESAELAYAEQLNPLYQQFASRVSKGIRNRQDSTGIYAHAIAVILETDDQALMKGITRDQIYEIAHSRQNRIQKGNLGKVLEKFEELQVDSEGRGLVLSYNEATAEIAVVDRQLLLYRKYATVKWPWEEMIKEADASGNGFSGD
ncbi:MAG: hypothetical protein WCI56_09430 [Hyphomicrobiales bacterium]